MERPLDTPTAPARPAAPPPVPGREWEQRPWGQWTVVHEGRGFKVKVLEIAPGHRLSLQYHKHRSELWAAAAGRATAVVDGRRFELRPMQSTLVPAGAIHRLGNPGPDPVVIVEIQQGEILVEDDIVRLEDDYQRTAKVGHVLTGGDVS